MLNHCTEPHKYLVTVKCVSPALESRQTAIVSEQPETLMNRRKCKVQDLENKRKLGCRFKYML